MSLDYSKVIMVGTSWATRGADGKLTRFTTAFEAAGGVVDADDSGDKSELFDVYKLTDGVRGKRPSKANVSREDAEAYVADRPDDAYEIAADA